MRGFLTFGDNFNPDGGENAQVVLLFGQILPIFRRWFCTFFVANQRCKLQDANGRDAA
jgi:hypothetical protein